MTIEPEPPFPATLFNFAAEHIHRAKSRGPIGQRGAASPNDLPLIDEDGLRFRTVPPAQDTGTRPAAGQRAGNPEAMASTFRAAFGRIWARIPEADRRRMLAHWQRGPIRRGDDADQGRPRWPLIRIVGDDPSSSPLAVVEREGNVLSFPAALVLAPPHVLRSEVLRALARAHHWATGGHWRQVMTLVEKPLDRWERRQGARATEAMLEQKTQALEASFLRAYEASISQTIRSWGVEDLEAIPE